MLAKIRNSISNNFIYLLEAMCFIFGISGVAAAIFFGKLLLALIVACLAVAVCFRLMRKRKAHTTATVNPSIWMHVITLLFLIILVARMAEVINLPVSFDQPRFRYLHWGLVGCCIFVSYWLMLQFLKKLPTKHKPPFPVFDTPNNVRRFGSEVVALDADSH